MIEIFFYSYLVSLHIYICGYLFFYTIIDRKVSERNNIFELFFYGSFILCFIALFLNFFISLNKFTNTILFILPFAIFLIKIDIKFIKRIFVASLPVATLFTLTIAYDGTFRLTQDLITYHISILNESKVIIGINNLILDLVTSIIHIFPQFIIIFF